MQTIRAGDLVKVIPGPSGFEIKSETFGTVAGTSQRFWDYGEGDCGFVDVAEVLVNGQILEIAYSFLELV